MNLLLMLKPIYAHLLYTACVQLKEVKMLSGVESWGMILLEKQEESEAAPKTKKGKVVKKERKKRKGRWRRINFFFSLFISTSLRFYSTSPFIISSSLCLFPSPSVTLTCTTGDRPAVFGPPAFPVCNCLFPRCMCHGVCVRVMSKRDRLYISTRARGYMYRRQTRM